MSGLILASWLCIRLLPDLPPRVERWRPDCAGSVVVSELHVNPSRVPDGRGEYVELFNPGPTFDLAGWRLHDGRRSWTVPTAEPRLFRHGEVLVIGPEPDRRLNGAVPIDLVWRGLGLGNTSGRFRVIDPCGRLVSEVIWPGPGWPRKLKVGRSIERVTAPIGIGRDSPADRAGAPAPRVRWRLARRRWARGDHGSPGVVSW